MTVLDLDFVRGHFPAFQESLLRDYAYFDSAGLSQTCRQVVWRLHRALKERHVEPGAPHPMAQILSAEIEEARTRLARVLGVGAETLTFGPSTSANLFVLAQAFGDVLGQGDVIVLSNQDHEANLSPWRHLARRGVEIREWRMDPGTGLLDPAALKPLLDERVRLVCFPHASNIVGAINPVAEIATMVHRVGGFVCVDGASYAGHGLPNVERLGADIYAWSAQKAFGPHQGIMSVRRIVSQSLPHIGFGEAPGLQFSPFGLDAVQVAACAGMVDHVDTLYARHFKAGRDGMARAAVVHDLIRSHENQLVQPLLDNLAARRNIRLIGPTRAAERVPIIAMVADRPGTVLAAELAMQGILCAGGVFRSDSVVAGLGCDRVAGVLRLSLAHYTSHQDVERLIAALDQVL